MKAIILSDVHLDVTENTRAKTAEFVAFLRSINPKDVNRLFILGDLFDFWFEYRHVIFSGYFDVLRAFADLRDAGVELHLVCGNHDYWAGNSLERIGVQVHPGPYTLDFAGKRVLLAHGDGVNPKDIGYLMFKRIARARPVVWLFGLLHPDWAMSLARFVSSISRRKMADRDFSKGPEVKSVADYARRIIESGDADVVILGHSHYPTQAEFDSPNGRTGLYLNTGDWFRNRTHVEHDGEKFHLITEVNK